MPVLAFDSETDRGERFARTTSQGAMRKHCKAGLGTIESWWSRQDVRFVVVETIVLNECA